VPTGGRLPAEFHPAWSSTSSGNSSSRGSSNSAAALACAR